MNDISISLVADGVNLDLEINLRTVASLKAITSTSNQVTHLLWAKMPPLTPNSIPYKHKVSGSVVLGWVNQLDNLRATVRTIKTAAANAKLVVDDTIGYETRGLLCQLYCAASETTDLTNVRSGAVTVSNYELVLDSVGIPRYWSKL